MNFDFEIYSLTNAFFIKYPSNLYPEILHKPNRPYHCLLIDTHIDYFICIPFRSEISHNQAYKFTSSKRSQIKKSGLDYKKMLIIKDNSFLQGNALVDHDEYVEAVNNIEKIVVSATKYLDDYVKHINKTKIIPESTFKRKYMYSTLPYFHDILGI